MGFNVVLIEPEIPNNTGNIGRLCLATGSTLHLVGPLGFDISDKQLKRSGLDYWQHLTVQFYENTEAFFEKHGDQQFALMSKSGKLNYTEISYNEDPFLVFGKESVGLPSNLLAQFPKQTFHIPMKSEHVRSLNLANAVSIVVYEGLRQTF